MTLEVGRGDGQDRRAAAAALFEPPNGLRQAETAQSRHVDVGQNQVVAVRPVPAQGPASGKAPAASARPYVWTDEPDGCTSIQVGRLASEDGSVMTAHTCDGNYRTWLEIVPAAKFEKGAPHPV